MEEKLAYPRDAIYYTVWNPDEGYLEYRCEEFEQAKEVLRAYPKLRIFRTYLSYEEVNVEDNSPKE